MRELGRAFEAPERHPPSDAPRHEMKPECEVARRSDYSFNRVPHAMARQAILAWHYAGGSSNTSVYAFGLFRGLLLVGAALWMPPTKVCALTVGASDWRRVLALSRLAIRPGEPQNAASILIGRCLKFIRREGKWLAAVTFADSSQGHLGGIYRATNWTHRGTTKPEPRWVDALGRQVARKATTSRTAAQMTALGLRMVGRFSKEKFTISLEPK